LRSLGYPAQVPIALSLVSVLLLVALGWRVFGGYPAGEAAYGRLSRREAAFLASAAEALFPPGGAVPPSGIEAGVPAWCDRWLAVLPAGTRLLVRGLFALMEHATLLFPASGWDGWRRFSALDAERRALVLERWRTSSWFPRRLVFTSLRAIVTQAYFAAAVVLRTLGLAPRAIDAPRHIADALYPPIGALPSQAAISPDAALVNGPLDRPPAGEPLGPHGALHPAYRETAR
jgi:hypothetical protein